MIFQPRFYQTAACHAVNQALEQGDSGLLVVLPTGAGKTVVLADLIHQWMVNWPDTRVCVLAHTKELVEQNAQKFATYWQQQQASSAPMGIYCAGLKQRNAQASVVFASIQSVTHKAKPLGFFDVLLIDEAHHIPTEKAEGIWRRFMTEATAINPNIRLVGLSATPYRLGSGPIIAKQTLLKRIVYQISVLELIRHGFLCPLITHIADAPSGRDLQGLSVRKGDYVAAEVEALMDQEQRIAGAVRDLQAQGADRNSWLIFCAGVRHAHRVQQALLSAGIATGIVTGNMPHPVRDHTINDFKAGRLRALCNVNVLTEGFDFPGIDLVALLRPTKSPGLYYQQVGRAFRLAPGKANALILDFAGVIAEHGPVDQLDQSVKTHDFENTTVGAPYKSCPKCGEKLPPATMQCPCGYVFPKTIHAAKAATDAAVLSDQIKPIRHEVTSVRYAKHIGKSGIPTLRVDYLSGLLRVASEWVCLEHSGPARHMAELWWRARGGQQVPARVEEALQNPPPRQPVAVQVKTQRKWPVIVQVEGL